ncbi:Arm DNA-binding domain-containing protein, partial [Sphingomonas sp. Leaf412]|uniref:Arm DNA-binding domain-containing protein n=1 Tax=Sphingomonas sp. Leaf412 TaxID=1736370 RepID=UPI0012E3D023
MARALNKLNVKQAAALTKPGRYSDGGGLYLRVTTTGSRSWVFMSVENKKRAEIGLGSANALPLAAARRMASEMREAV